MTNGRSTLSEFTGSQHSQLLNASPTLFLLLSFPLKTPPSSLPPLSTPQKNYIALTTPSSPTLRPSELHRIIEECGIEQATLQPHLLQEYSNSPSPTSTHSTSLLPLAFSRSLSIFAVLYSRCWSRCCKIQHPRILGLCRAQTEMETQKHGLRGCYIALGVVTIILLSRLTRYCARLNKVSVA